MGFDNECILNIQSLAGEYFCPVCRLLVYPSEALQSQCTHLYCKPCLSYVVSTTKACPYDGYLVTEADSKPLIESNKILAETIGKIEVHCLYHRSGCPWKGPLSDCTTHCSGCAFGNSPVVCNRCGVQIVHRQVQDHAQNCPGVQSQAQPTAGLQSKSATAASADQAKVVTQPGSATSQALPLQGITTPAQGQNQNQPDGSINYPLSTAQATSDQWYQQQQQYQQYYQPYAGYDPYQQYNPYQQQTVQQYQQHQGHAYPPTASALQTLQSTQAQPQTQLQPHPQPQALSQPPTQSSVQPPPQTQPHSLVNVQPAATQQLQPQLSIPSLPQMQPHTHQTAQGHPQPQPQQHHHSLHLPQSHSMQSYPQQQLQILPYQQSQSQMQNLQPQAQSQPQPQMPIPQPHSQAQPPVQARFPTQQYQPAITKIQAPVQHPSALPMTNHQSYPQIHTHQQVQLATPQHIAHMQPQTGPSQHVQHGSQVHVQLPQQAMHMRPSQPQGDVPNNQPPALLPSTGQSQNTPSTQKQFVQPPQQQGYSGQHHPYVQSNQQVPRPPQFVPQQSSVPQQHLHMPANAQLHPQGLPLSQNQSTAYLQSQQTGMPPYQSQVGPSMSNFNVLPHSVGDQKYASRTNLQLQSAPDLQSANSQFEDKHLSGKNISGQGVKAPEQQVYDEKANASVAMSDSHVDSVETNVLMSETDSKLREDNSGKDKASLNGRFSAEYATGISPELRVLGNGESTNNQVMKHGAGDGTRETMSGNPQQDSNGLRDEAKHPSFQEDARQKTEIHDKGSLAFNYGPSSVQQKSLSGQTHAQVPGHPQHQFRSQNADTFLPPAPGAMSGPRPEHGLGQPPAHRNFEQPSSHPGLSNQGFPSVDGSFLGAVPPGSIDSHGVMTRRAQPHGPDSKTGLQRPISRSGLWEDGFNKITREGHLYPFDMEPGGRVARVGEFQNLNRYPMPPNVDSENYFPSSRTDDRFTHKFGLDPLSRNSDKGPHGFINETQLRNSGERLLPGGFGDDNMGRPNFPHPDFLGPDTGYGRYPSLASRNSHQEYPGAYTHGISPTDRSGRDIGGRNSRRFGEGSRPFSLHSESKEFPLHEKEFPNMPPHLRRGEPESNMNMQMGDNVPPGPSHMLRSGELIGHDPLPGHFHRGEHFRPNNHLRVGEPAAFGAFSSLRIGDMSRFGNFPTRRGEAGFRSVYSPQDSNFFMGEESFENPRKRKSAASTGWCRICKVDCGTVEGLDVHSQTREHQRKSMDMVLKIKQKNTKKQKLNTDHSSVDELKDSRIGGFEGRGDKR